MAGKGISIVAAFCVMAGAFGHEALDLSKDPRLQLPVDLHLKRVLLPELLSSLHTRSNQKFILARELEPLMVCVFARQRPLWEVMTDVADVMGCQWKDLGSEWRLDAQPEARAGLSTYPLNEQTILEQRIVERGTALAKFVESHAWQSGGSSDPGRDDSHDTETPDQWAQRRASDPAYFTAGLMFARTGVLDHLKAKFDCPTTFTQLNRPVAYRLITPPTAEIAATNQCGPAGPNAPGLAGFQICARSLLWAGTLQAIAIDGASHKPERPAELCPLPRPVGELAATPAGKWLLEWETRLEDSKDDVLDKPVEDIEVTDSHFFRHQIGIEDVLDALATRAGISVVCDGFRVPLLGKVPPTGTTVRAVLESLSRSQKCFVKVVDGRVLVRHGGFWDLRQWEPPEALIRQMEVIRRPGLDEYAELAYDLCSENRLTGHLTDILPFFESRLVPLTHFDPTPLCDSYLALAAFGQMADAQRLHILNGGYIDLYRNEYDVRDTPTLQVSQGRDARGKTIQVYTVSGGGEWFKGHDEFVDTSALWGPFYGGRPTRFELRLFESTGWPSSYRLKWGDSPDVDMDYLTVFDAIGVHFAHRLRLINRPVEAGSGIEGPPGPLVGRFTFFAYVSDADGVQNDVVIPAGPGA